MALSCASSRTTRSLSLPSRQPSNIPSRICGVDISNANGPLSSISSKLYAEQPNGSSPEQQQPDYASLTPQVYPQRWVQLTYLSLLALLSDWICFSVAASPSTFESAYPGHSAASLIDIFLFTNVASCFVVTDIVAKFGLEFSIKGAAALMSLGCLLRSGPSFVGSLVDWLGVQSAGAANVLSDITPLSDFASLVSTNADGLLPYPLILAGTIW